MTLLDQCILHHLPQSLYEFWRIVQSRAHLKLCHTKSTRFLARFMVDLAQCFYMIGNERNWHNANFANALGG